MKDIYNHPPEIKKQYGWWTVTGKPQPSLVRDKSDEHGYKTKWQVPCKCRCGRRDLIYAQDLESGESIQCVVCDKLGFLESLAIRPGKPSMVVEAFGEIKCVCDWVKDSRCACKTPNTIRDRIKRGMSPEEAIINPVNPGWRGR